MEELTVIYCLYSIPDVSFTNSKQADMCLHSVGGKNWHVGMHIGTVGFFLTFGGMSYDK